MQTDLLKLPAYRAEMPIRENDINEILDVVSTLERILRIDVTPFKRVKAEEPLTAVFLNRIYESVVRINKACGLNQKMEYFPVKSGDAATEGLFNELVGSINLAILRLENAANSEMVGPIRLHGIKRGLSPGDLEILESVWDYYIENSSHIPARLLFSKIEAPKAKAEIEKIGGALVFETSENGVPCYQITFLGLMATSRYPKIERVLVKYLEFVREKYKEDPLCKQIEHNEIEKKLKLTADESVTLEKVLRLANLSGGSSGYNYDTGFWSASYPEDVQELRFVEDIRGYILEHCYKYARFGDSVSEQGRYANYFSERESSIENSRHRSKREIEPEPPGWLKQMVWIQENWKLHWKLILVGSLFTLVLILVK